MKPREWLDLGDLPGDIAAQQQSTLGNPQRLRRARTQLLLSARGRTLERKPARRPLGRRAWAPIALAAALTLAVTALRWRAAPLTFEIASGVPGQVGRPLQAPVAAPMTLRFSDGTALAVAPGSKVRIDEVAAQGAGVVLEDGAVAARVVHRSRSRWLVHAGPYRVLVTGTRFDVRWDARQHSFTLALHDGEVTVFGPSLGASGKRVRPSETVRFGPEAPSRASQASESAPSAAPSAAGAEPRPTASVSAAPLAAAPASWKSLAAAGNYAAAFAAAETEGFGNICRHASIGDLLLLGNTARLAKRTARAEEAFLAVRARPGATRQRAVAAFQLGRLAQDTRGDPARGASWFETYLAEAPDGTLAREAAGRVMEAHHRAGNAPAARLAARRYLDRNRGGPYETLARRLLEQ
jgi:hypothetical protein